MSEDEYDEYGQEVAPKKEESKSAPDAVIFAGTLMLFGQGALVGFILLYGASIAPTGMGHVFIPIYMATSGLGFFLIIMLMNGHAFSRWFMLCFQLMVVMTVYKSWGDLAALGTFSQAILGITSACWWISIMVMFYSSSVSGYYAEGNPFGSAVKSRTREATMKTALTPAGAEGDDDGGGDDAPADGGGENA